MDQATVIGTKRKPARTWQLSSLYEEGDSKRQQGGDTEQEVVWQRDGLPKLRARNKGKRPKIPVAGILNLEALGRVELPTNGLGNRCSIHLSYRAF